MATHTWHCRSGETRGRICQVTNVTSLGEVTQTKVVAPVCYIGLFFFCWQHKRLSDSVQRPAVTDGKRSVKKVWSTPPFTSSGAPDRRCFKTRTTRGENLSSSSPSLSYIMLFWKQGQQTSTTIQPCTHRPEREREREDGSPEKESALECLEQTLRYNIKVVSFPTWIHATTMQRNIGHEVASSDHKLSRPVANIKK